MCQEENKKESSSDVKERSWVGNLVDKLKHFCLTPSTKIEINTMEDIANFISSGECKRIVVLCGAGISTSCGIPDFRSPKTGIFENLAEYNLPYPEALFCIDYFEDNPKPFFEFSRNVLEKVLQAKPSYAHYFIKLLADNGLLTRVYTQNIDALELLAGIDEKLVCFAHGTFKHAHCIEKSHPASVEYVIEQIRSKSIPRCDRCGSVIKPDIVFYGEPLPKTFEKCLSTDYNKVDLLIVMGTSLTVRPVSCVAEMIPRETPRLLLNKTNVWKFCVKPTNHPHSSTGSKENDGNSRTSSPDDFYMTKKMAYQDVFFKDDCDNGCKKLAELLGWSDTLENMYKQGHMTTPSNATTTATTFTNN